MGRRAVDVPARLKPPGWAEFSGHPWPEPVPAPVNKVPSATSPLPARVNVPFESTEKVTDPKHDEDIPRGHSAVSPLNPCVGHASSTPVSLAVTNPVTDAPLTRIACTVTVVVDPSPSSRVKVTLEKCHVVDAPIGDRCGSPNTRKGSPIMSTRAIVGAEVDRVVAGSFVLACAKAYAV